MFPDLTRRSFLAASAAAAAPAPARATEPPAIDFRYAPASWQTAFCFPDDHNKSLAGERGELRYGFSSGKGFSTVVEFTLRGMEADRVAAQWLEGPGVPIVRTRIDRPEAWIDLIAFATNRADEGRVDNVLLEVRPRAARAVPAGPAIKLRTRRAVRARGNEVRLDEGAAPFLVADGPLGSASDGGFEWVIGAREAIASADRPARWFFRFPQEGQTAEKLRAGLAEPDRVLAEARAWWRSWRAFGGQVNWQAPGRYGEFLLACARNILQAREMRDGRLTFQVGPTVYRGLWVVDGHFILESARYLGYDAEAQQGLEATWARQDAEGGIFAGAGRQHWKDTGIAMFTLVRQAELSQDWTYFRKMRPEVLRAAAFVRKMRDEGRNEASANGRYGLLPRGMGDGGLGGLRSEFTNTLWTVAGLRAVSQAAARQRIDGFEPVTQLHRELSEALFAAARQEMRRHPAGFDYLPMLMKEDAAWSAANERERPQPQVAQWALSHAIYPGLLFGKDDPVVKGHVALMQACTREDIPAETGWIPHEGLWNYNAAFAAHAYLWAGVTDWARSTFYGFLNHATPLYCWREEQPLQGTMTAGYVGDMPHNWASAECVLYLRHMLALEDGDSLRLLAGIGEPELAERRPWTAEESPSRFGRLGLALEPAGRGWRLEYKRGAGPEPGRVELPAVLGGLRLDRISGADSKREGDAVLVAPGANAWTASWT